ncbi:MAG: AraC family transcriptional regulator ligand-binding domain-containing protein [Rhodopila sp.]|nr:AraC family transcriptional regulator ligand-binding domain-containing protein [Rhodopila sp.]
MSHHPLPERRNLLRLGAAALIPEILQERGISTEAVFGRAGLSRRSLAQPDLIVPLTRLGQIFKSAVAATGQAEFGLLVGLRAGPRLIDPGQGPTPSDTHVSAALMRVISRPAMFPNALVTFSVSGNTCTIGCVALPRNAIARDYLSDCVMGFAAGTLRVLCGPRWRPWGFRFDHGPPPDPSGYAALLQAPISFDANVTAMEFDSAWLERDCASPQGRASGDVHERRLHRDVVGEVRGVLASWNAVDRPSAPAVASELGLQPRTLNRLLARTGTSFNRVLEDTRYETAQRMLRDPAAPVVSIAWSLGYADASAFSRAFRRWSGMTPTEWRKEAECGAL